MAANVQPCKPCKPCKPYKWVAPKPGTWNAETRNFGTQNPERILNKIEITKET